MNRELNKEFSNEALAMASKVWLSKVSNPETVPNPSYTNFEPSNEVMKFYGLDGQEITQEMMVEMAKEQGIKNVDIKMPIGFQNMKWNGELKIWPNNDR